MSKQFKAFVKGVRLRDNDDTGIGDLSGVLTADDDRDWETIVFA